jgi:ribosomal protein L11 methyltransferase
VAVEQPVESSLDGDIVNIPGDRPLLVKTYVSLTEPDWSERRERIEQAAWALGKLRHVEPVQVRSLREEDWANAWKEHFFVTRVAERTVIVPSWRKDEYEPQPNDIVLLLDPGMAFGTGLHPTSRLCLAALEKVITPGVRVLDVGAGSGILCIAAVKLGSGHIDAVEIEPVAARVCQENDELNGVADMITVYTGSLDVVPIAEPYDLIVANITIRTITQLRHEIAERAASQAPTIFSGVLAERAHELIDLLVSEGWTYQFTEQEGDWVAITALAPRRS